MKKLLIIGLTLGLISQTTFAEETIAPNVSELAVTNVGSVGTVLKNNTYGATQNVLVGIPVNVATGSVCVDFVGQMVEQSPIGPNMTLKKIKVLGAEDAMIDACIEIAPMPVPAQLTVRFSRQLDVENLPIGGKIYQSIKLKTLDGEKIYSVSLDPVTQEVGIVKAIGR